MTTLAQALIKYGRPFWSAIGDDNAASVAGSTQMLSDYLFGPEATDAQRSFEAGRRAFKQGLRKVRFENPYGAFAAEMAGNMALWGIGDYGTRKAFGKMAGAFNRWDAARGERALRKALERGFFPMDITTGRLSRQRMQEINQMRRSQGFEELTDRRVVWPTHVQRHVWQKRILGDRVSPAKVANWQREVFFGPNSRVYPNPKYPGITQLRAPSAEKVLRGFLTKETKTGRTKATSILRSRAPK